MLRAPSLAHEINQPLTAILSNAATAVRFLDAPQPNLQDLREALADIHQDSYRAGEVVHRISDMLRRDAPGFSNVELNQVIRSVEAIVHSDSILHHVTVELNLSPPALTVRGDTVQLQQVILNLMLNAFTAMSSAQPTEQRLIVRTTLVDRSLALVEVQDNGPGIPPDEIETIFDPFVTSKPNGLGMGLSICRFIIERHGGKLWATNNLSRGATFSITLPIIS